jgi:hypothetical protein
MWLARFGDILFIYIYTIQFIVQYYAPYFYSLLRFLFLSVFAFSNFFSAALFFGLAVTDKGIMFPSVSAPVLLGTFSPVAFPLSVHSVVSSAVLSDPFLLLDPVAPSFGAKFSRDSDFRNSTLEFIEWISVISFARLAKLS